MWGFVGEAAYVGTRQIDQLGFKELNWSPIGGGQAGRQLNQQFGRTGQTRLIAPIGDSQYDALQARLDRRFRTASSSASTTRCPSRPASPAIATATARCGSTSPSTTI